MAQIKSQMKRILTNEKARVANSGFKSKMRTAMKKVVAACNAKDKALAEENYKLAASLIDQSISKGIQHANTAMRQKSHLAKLVNSIVA